MKFFIKTQFLAIIFSLLWVIYLNILGFFDQPGRALQYINWFVYGFAILFAILCFIMTKYVMDRNWLAVPLVLIPYFLLYNPIFQRIIASLYNEGYRSILSFFSRSTGTTYLIATTFGLILGIMFSKKKN